MRTDLITFGLVFRASALGALPFFGEESPGFRVKVAESRVLSDLDHVAETLVALEAYQQQSQGDENPMEAPNEVANELETFLKDARKLDDVAGAAHEQVSMSRTLFQSLQSAEQLLAFIRVETRQALSAAATDRSFEEYQTQALSDFKIWSEKVNVVSQKSNYPSRVKVISGLLRKSLDSVTASLEGRVSSTSVNLEIVPSKETMLSLETNWKSFLKVCAETHVDEMTAIREASLLAGESLEALLKFVSAETTKVALEVAKAVTALASKDQEAAPDALVLRQLDQELAALSERVTVAETAEDIKAVAGSIGELKDKSQVALMDASEEQMENLSRVVETLGYLEDALKARVFSVSMGQNVFDPEEVQKAIDNINQAAKKERMQRLSQD